MLKNILIIDDSPDARELELFQSDIEEELNSNSPFKHEVNLTVLNPNDLEGTEGSTEKMLEELEKHLAGKVLSEKLDLFLCDFNLNIANKDLAFFIIGIVRKYNKCCSVILYSGSPLKELTRINNQELANQISTHILTENKTAGVEALKLKIDKVTKEELPSEELLKLALESDISKIVSRTDYKQVAIDVIQNPSLVLRLENSLLLNGEDKVFHSTGFSLDGKPIGEICGHIRKQTGEGINFCNELMELMSAHYIKLHS